MPAMVNEMGNRYERLTVLERTQNNRHGAAQWLCRCDCGELTTALGSSLRFGRTKSCGCLHKEAVRRVGVSNVVNREGHKYGRWTVIKRCGSNGSGQAAWLCKCDCGKEGVVTGTNLQSGTSKSCGCLRREIVRRLHTLPEGEAAFNAVVSVMEGSARVRGYEWQLTKEQIRYLTKQSCHYCGDAPSQVYKNPRVNGNYVYNGLDRVDNDKGYTTDNVVSCCFVCNRAKSVMTLKEFRSWAFRLCEHLAGCTSWMDMSQKQLKELEGIEKNIKPEPESEPEPESDNKE